MGAYGPIGRWARRSAQLASALVSALAVVGLLAAPSAQATTSPWVDGPVTDYGSWDCGIFSTTGQLSLDPAVGESWISYQGNPTPQTNSPYYIGLLYTSAGDSLQSDGSCVASQDVSLSLALPPGTTVDIGSSTPVVCFLSGAQFTDGCPSASTGSSNGYAQFNPSASTVWNVAYGDTIEIAVPVKSTEALSTATGAACTNTAQGCAASEVDMWDGFGNPYTEYATLGLTVQAGTQSNPTPSPYISYPAQPTSDIGSDTATFEAIVNQEGLAGSAYAEVATDGSNGSCTSLGTPSKSSPTALSSGFAWEELQTPWNTSLSPSTAYCWNEVFTPSSGSPVAGAWQPFTTRRTRPILVIPTDFNLSTPNADKTYDSAELTGTLGLTSLASSTYTRLGLDTEADPDTPGGACTPSDVSGIQDLNQFTFSSAEVNAGSAPVTTYFTGLRSLTKYCWQQVVTLSDGDTQSSDWIVFDTNAYLAPLITVNDNSTSNIGSTSAIANATINDGGFAGVATAQLGTPSGGSCSSPTGVSSAATNGLTGNSSTQTVGPTLTGLQPSTSYCWREAFAVAGGVTDDGAWISFTTAAAPAGGSGGGGGGAGGAAGSPGSGGGGAPGKSLVGAFTSLDLASSQKGTSVGLSLVIGNAGSTITVNVYAPQAEVATAAKAKHHKKPSLVLLGHLSEIVSASGPLKLKVSLNAKGKAALNARGHVTVTVDTSVTPPGGTAESSSNAVTLHRHH